MKKYILVILCLLLLSPGAFAHRLNEYLQATTINLSNGHIYFEFRLTPGVDVAPGLIKLIDINGDDIISQTEQLAYIGRLAHDLSVNIDGVGAALIADSSSFCTTADMRQGIGDIIIYYEANIPPGGTTHTLTLQNNHLSSIAARMVSCLVPSGYNIAVTGQDRSYDQSNYTLHFTTAGTGVHSNTSLQRDDKLAVTKEYFFRGVTHILTGYDHLLFLAALVIAATSLWQLVKIVTAFTIAHSITLTLAVLNIVRVPEAIVEPIISASIVFVALQNIFWTQQAKGNTRLAVTFIFGLFHGLGFASGLLEIMHQLPGTTIFLAIVGFTIGIETGNQLVLLPLFGVLKIVRSTTVKTPVRINSSLIIQKATSIVIALAGTIYLCSALLDNFS